LCGDRFGKRLNQLYKENLGEEEILQEVDYFLNQYSQHRQAKDSQDQENFGDFIFRTIFTGEKNA
jgi:sulfite reductase (NADPH) hemoprotein beta-component